ncbi:hypothetical protein E3N88_16632 [Mikania micrantha]|uniref:DDE Tnp4 domain-containing protein n=1 Tax=Mikania micrantha TaxID=192012 RepID=A0A5N6NZB9_9ASTR|nr:hypothetical protein E3N88_16632 [Mikania micrantha]
MESSDDEKYGASTANGLMPAFANGTKFVDEILNGDDERCLENFRMGKHVKLVVAACALHNYIRDETPDDIIFKMFEHENYVSKLEESIEKPVLMMMDAGDDETMDVDVHFDAQQMEQSSQLRDTIAAEIWNDYVHDFPIIP